MCARLLCFCQELDKKTDTALMSLCLTGSCSSCWLAQPGNSGNKRKLLPSLTSAIFHALSCLFDLSKNKIETQQQSHKSLHLHRTKFPCYVILFVLYLEYCLLVSVKTTISHSIISKLNLFRFTTFVLFVFCLIGTHLLNNKSH